MDYYQTFKPEADKVASALAGKVIELTKTVDCGSKRLTDERDKRDRIEQQIAKLKALSGESLVGSKNSYEKFRTEIRKSTDDLDASNALVELLSRDVLPKAQTELTETTTNLKNMLNALILRCRPVADMRINSLLVECVRERQDFLDAFARIFSDFGLVFVVNDEGLCPGVWRADELRDVKIRLGMPDNSAWPNNTPVTEGLSRPCSEGLPPAAAAPDTKQDTDPAEALHTTMLGESPAPDAPQTEEAA